MSYYIKGAVLAFLLDARIRRATAGERSLDDALRLAYRRFSGVRGYTPAELVEILSESAGEDLSPFLHQALWTTEELDLSPALEWFGLRLAPAGDAADRPWLGAALRVEEGRIVVWEVKRGSPVWEAGLNVGDELLACNDQRLPPFGFEERLRGWRPGDRVSLLVARRERLVRLPVVLGSEPTTVKLELDPAADGQRKSRLDAWLGAVQTPVEVPS